MDFIWQSITDWLKEILVSGVISNLTNMFDSTNTQVGGIVSQVGLTPQAWNSGIFSMQTDKALTFQARLFIRVNYLFG